MLGNLHIRTTGQFQQQQKQQRKRTKQNRHSIRELACDEEAVVKKNTTVNTARAGKQQIKHIFFHLKISITLGIRTSIKYATFTYIKQTKRRSKKCK